MAIQIRRGSNSGWESNNSNIVVGEPAIVTDEERFFVGTGTGDYAEFANINAIAPPYDTTTQYYIDDYTNHQGKIYVCIEPTSGAWDSTKWLVTSLGEALAENRYSNFEMTSASGDIVSFNNGAGDIPVKDLQVSIEAVQSGSGDPAPDNVCPISGWSSVNVNVAGENIFDYEKWKGTAVTRGTAVYENNGITITATSNDAYTQTGESATVPVKEGMTVKLSWESGSGNGLVYLMKGDINKNFSVAVYTDNNQYKSLTWTIPNGIYYVQVRFGVTTTGNTISYKNIVMRTDGQATYEPYIGRTTTTSLGSTYYGGSLNVTTGVLTISRVMKVLDGSESWSTNSANTNLYYFALPSTAKTDCNLLSDKFIQTAVAGSAMVGGQMKISTRNVNFKYDEQTSLANWKTWLGNNNVQLLYELATPQTVQLTKQQVRTVLHENNIWADSGSVNVTYRISNV